MRAFLLSFVLVACAAPKRAEPPANVVLCFPDPGAHAARCDAVVHVPRALARTDVDAVLRALFAGPNEDERARGVIDPFAHPLAGVTPDAPLAAAYRGVDVTERTARIRFDGAALAYLNAAMCAQEAVKSAIAATLRARGIEEVRYVIDGVEVTEWDA